MAALKIPSTSAQLALSQSVQNAGPDSLPGDKAIYEGQQRQSASIVGHPTAGLSKLRHLHTEARPVEEKKFTLPNVKPADRPQRASSPKSTDSLAVRRQYFDRLIDQLQKRAPDAVAEQIRLSITSDKITRPERRSLFKPLNFKR